jgi:hypothetical protein
MAKIVPLYDLLPHTHSQGISPFSLAVFGRHRRSIPVFFSGLWETRSRARRQRRHHRLFLLLPTERLMLECPTQNFKSADPHCLSLWTLCGV